MTSIYNTGTVTVTNGSAAVVGTGTAWAVALVTGGTLNIEAAGNPMPILSVTDNTHLTGAVKWTGASGTYSYAIVREDSAAANIVDLYDKLTRVLVQLSLAGITPNNSGTLAKRNALALGAGDDNYLFLHAEIGVAFAFYRWDGPSLAWVGPFPVANAVAAGGVSSIAAGTGIAINNANPAIPVISSTLPATPSTWSAVQTFSAIPVLSGGGVKFPATQIPSADANTLDDYEEGTWTPALTFVTQGNLAVTYGGQTGTYVKVGKMVSFSFLLIASTFTFTTAAGALQITGLPFGTAGNFVGAGAVLMQGYTKANFTTLLLETGTNGQQLLYLMACGSGQSRGELAAADIPSGTSKAIYGSGTYNAS
ncbi:hypothetical protein [Mesorhizobium sp. M0715]|uniref:hypothetical protein n=1 Tax=Mesorhizobium sp. M0715 TaxID=2956990 RepID=UPI003338A37F